MIIVSMTTWNKRINQIEETINSILNQTVKPDKIELNLDYENFPNGYDDIPENIKKMPIDINFYHKDFKCWLKIIPTIRKHYGEQYVLFTIDDDITYPPTYIEESMNELFWGDWLCTNSDTTTNGQYMAYKSYILNRFVPILSNELIEHNKLDDVTIKYLIDKAKFKRVNKIQSKCIDRNVGYSFRRYYTTNNMENVTNSNTDYPIEEVKKEIKYLEDLKIQYNN
jgi:hypothetical protein